MIRYMQKQFYDGLIEKDSLKTDMGLEWFNNCGVFIGVENNILCNDCPLDKCLECKDIICEEDYLMDMAYDEQWCDNCKNFGKLEDEPYICGEEEWCEYWEAKE